MPVNYDASIPPKLQIDAAAGKKESGNVLAHIPADARCWWGEGPGQTCWPDPRRRAWDHDQESRRLTAATRLWHLIPKHG